MDLATILGLLIAWGALIGSLLMEGGDARALINIPAALLVFGGTLGAATISFRMNQIMDLPDILKQAFNEPTQDPADVIRLLVRFAERARRDGLLVLEAEVQRVSDPFLKTGIRLAVDGTDPETLREILTTEVHFLRSRHKTGEHIFTTLAGFAPTLGIIGTVMGLIHMLANLSDPGKMGPLIAGRVYRHAVRRFQRQSAVPAHRQQTQRPLTGRSAGARSDDRRHPGDTGGRQSAHRGRQTQSLSRSPLKARASRRERRDRRLIHPCEE